MVNHRLTSLIFALGALPLAATVSAQHPRSISKTSADQTAPVRPISAPQASIAGPGNGLYCPDMGDKAVGMHDLGWIPSGRNVVVIVQAIVPADFDPVATVLVATLGVPGGGTAKTSTFYDNDSGGGKDPQISFTTPTDGSYFLMVGANSGTGGGCYRYQVTVS